jgi:spore germination protein
MAVAPLNQVKRVVDYAVTEIPPNKILMGIPNYGYDWTLPFEQGVSRAVSIGNDYAVTVAARNNSTIKFDEIAQSPYFNYWRLGRFKHEVWFEDVRSIKAKYDLLVENNLLGTGYWNIMRLFVQNWSLVNAMFNIDKIV